MKAWLRFFRAVNLPTVPGDVLVGAAALLANGLQKSAGSVAIAAACVASLSLYMFGLADNDIVGAKTDEGRPIPDGQISMRAARIARALCVIGAIAVGLAPDPVALRPLPWMWWPAAFALVCLIVVYNRTKNWAWMGFCRGLNVACGAVAVLPSLDATGMSRPLWIATGAALVWTVYIAAVTKYSEGEEMDAAKKRRVGFLIGAIVYLQLIALIVFPVKPFLIAGAVLLIVLRLMKRLLPEVSAS